MALVYIMLKGGFVDMCELTMPCRNFFRGVCMNLPCHIIALMYKMLENDFLICKCELNK